MRGPRQLTLNIQVTANDIYATILGWLAPSARTSADIQLSSICPATEKARLVILETSYACLTL